MKVGTPSILYRQVMSKESGADTYTFYGSYVGVKQILVLHQLAVSDLTTASKALLIGYQEGDGDIKWVKKIDQANHFSCWMNGQLILVENERPVGRVESPSDGDDLRFVAMGYVYKEE